MTQGDDSGNPAKLVAWRCFGVYKSCCWNDGAKGSDLEGEEVMSENGYLKWKFWC